MQDSLGLDFGQGLESNSGSVFVNLQHLGQGGSAMTYLVLCSSGFHEGQLFALKIFRRRRAMSLIPPCRP